MITTIQTRRQQWIILCQSAHRSLKISQGAFSLASGKNEDLIIVGGDYENDKRTDSVATIQTDIRPGF
jgi:hypothetical protein